MSNPKGNNQFVRNRFSSDEVYGADFETDHNPEETDTWVCQWAISDGHNEMYGRTIDEFEIAVMSLLEDHDQVMIYFHNAKFDTSFMMGLFHKWESEGWNADYLVRDGSPMNLKFEMDGKILCIRDSMKKIPGKLEGIGRLIGVPKLDNPSESNFEPGWSDKLDYEMDSPDWEYVKHDARIVALAMRNMHERKQDSISASGQTYKNAKKKLNMNASGTGFSNKWGNRFYKMPIELDLFFRDAYYGGLNVSRHIGLNVATKERPIVHEDIHSSYPTVMCFDPMPYGVPWVLTYEPPNYGDGVEYIANRRVKLTLKPGMFPWFQFKNKKEYLKEGLTEIAPIERTEFYHELTLCSVDWRLLERWYDVEYDPEYEDLYYCFLTEIGFMRPYIEGEFIGKERSEKNGLEYLLHKLNINSLYGRMGLRRESSKTELVYDEDTDWYKWESTVEDDESIESYIPYAVFCTAYARKRLLENCMAVGPENVIHCDTDSVIHYGEPSPNIKHLDRKDVTDPMDMLGSWGIESRPVAVWEGGFKRYIEYAQYPPRTFGDIIGTALAGVPKNVKNGVPMGLWVEILDNPESIVEDSQYGHKEYRIRSEWLRNDYIKAGKDPDKVDTMKLLPIHVHGGTILTGTTYRMSGSFILRFR